MPSRSTTAGSALALVLVLVLVPALGPAVVSAQSRDRTAIGDAVVSRGESVDDVTAFGGSVIVDGEVRGDVTAFGGSVRLGPHARVFGDTNAFGGRVEILPGAWAPRVSAGWVLPAPPPLPVAAPALPLPDHEEVGAVARSLVAHALLFLLGLFLLGLVPDRMGAMHVAIVRDPLRTVGAGVGAYVMAFIVLIGLAVSLIGIPAAVALAVAVPVVTYVGLAGAASVVGAALPMEGLRGSPVKQLLAGVGVLFVVSLVPVVGAVLVAVCACLGVGALVRTRFRAQAPLGLVTGEGPYRAPAA